jgi:hypothetical protein
VVDGVGDGVGDCVGDGVVDGVGDSVLDGVVDGVGGGIGDCVVCRTIVLPVATVFFEILDLSPDILIIIRIAEVIITKTKNIIIIVNGFIY